MTPRALPELAETEKGFQTWILDLADLYGWEHYHPWLSVHSARGWPDLALCRPPRLVLAEIKGPKGKLSPSQKLWIDLLGRCPGIEVYVWFPQDRDRIARLLK